MRKIFVIAAAVVLLASCVSKGEYDIQKGKVDSLMAVCKDLQKENDSMRQELEQYKYSPSRLLANIRNYYKNKHYMELKENVSLLLKYHPDAEEVGAANAIYEKVMKEEEAARKKAEALAAKQEAERKAKMSKIERIMEKYGCNEEIATCISMGRVRIGMTAEQCRAAWGRPSDINRSSGPWGVHEQWCYGLRNYLYMENGILKSIQN